MAKCARCGNETELHVGGVPICHTCVTQTAKKPTLSEVNTILRAAKIVWMNALAAQHEV